MNDLLGLLGAFQSFHTAFCPAIYLQEKQNTQQQPEWQKRGKKSTSQARFQQHRRNCAVHSPVLHMNSRIKEAHFLQSSAWRFSSHAYITDA